MPRFEVSSFGTLRTWEGEQSRAFEELSFQLLKDRVPAGTQAIRTGNPDGGVEWYAVLPDGVEWGWQAKHVQGIDALLTAMTESVRRVAEERHTLRKLTFVISWNLATSRQTKRGKQLKSQREKYNDKVATWQQTIPAGVFRSHPILDTSYEDWQREWQLAVGTNLVGAANVTWCAVRHMRPGARVVNVSSRGAFRGEPDAPAYGASKAGLNALGQSLAVALAPHRIAVATVAPGFVATDMTNEHLKPPRGDAIRAQSPFGRVARPEEIAEAVRWLASPAAEWASGTIVDLNGASYLRS